MLRLFLIVSATFAVVAPRAASADCAPTCDDICYAPADTAYFRAQVTAAMNGYATRARLVERLSGPAIGTIGEELDGIYSEGMSNVGDELFVAIAAYTDGTPGTYVYNVARPIVGGEVVCEFENLRVAVDQYAAMAASPDCLGIAAQLEIDSPPCDDSAGCNAGSGGALGVGLAGLLVLVGRRRRRG